MPNCTVRYAAPEVATSRQRNTKLAVTTAVDTWAIALILHELFSGEPLLDDEARLASRPVPFRAVRFTWR